MIYIYYRCKRCITRKSLRSEGGLKGLDLLHALRPLPRQRRGAHAALAGCGRGTSLLRVRGELFF